MIEREGKLGLGTAYCRGFHWALERDYDPIIQMDADLSHNPDDIPRLIDASESCDSVIGSRYIEGVNVVNWPMRRLLLSNSSSACNAARSRSSEFAADTVKRTRFPVSSVFANGHRFMPTTKRSTQFRTTATILLASKVLSICGQMLRHSPADDSTGVNTLALASYQDLSFKPDSGRSECPG